MNRNMKAYLKSAEGAFYALAPKVTTVGKDGCDILLQNTGVDQQHAIIEYSEQEDCYVLQDLNTAQGTYVNDVRVQNAAVRLAPGDIVRFGYGGTPYELNVENPPPIMSRSILGYQQQSQQISYPPVQHRPAWTQPLALLTDDTLGSPTSQPQAQGSLPYLTPYITTPTLTIPSAHWTPVANGVPRPPLRSRPLSAGSRREQTFNRLQTIGSNMQTSTAAGVLSPGPRSGGWVNTGTGRSAVTSQMVPPSPTAAGGAGTEIYSLQEKDQKIHQLSDEISRLRSIEMDSFRKDQQVQQLQQKLKELESRTKTQQPVQNGGPQLTYRLDSPSNRSQQQSPVVSGPQIQQQASMGGAQVQQQGPMVMGGDPEMTAKLLQLETEVAEKKQEIEQLKEQLVSLQSDSENPATLRIELNNKLKELNSLKNEMERTKKDKNITSGLVTQMQRDMSNKDSSISKLTREIEALKKELREKDSELNTMTTKVNKLKEPRTEERDARERELVSLRQKFKTTESKVQEQQTLIDSLREELEKTKVSLFDEKEVQRKLQLALDQAKTESQDFERAERVVRVDLEQASKKMERFRSRVVQVTFSTPGIKAPDTEISDDSLLDTLKKLINERTELQQKIKELDQQLKMTDTNSKDFQKNMSDIRKILLNAKAHLKQNGRLSGSLKDEISLIQSATVDESLSWMKEFALGLLQAELSWETDIENALEKCGVNTKLTNDEPGKHISLLYAKWESAIGEKERLVKQMGEMETRFKEDLHQQLEAQKSDAEGNISDAVEKAKLEVEVRLNRAIDEIRAVEDEKRENAVSEERRISAELRATIDELRANLAEKSEDQQSRLEEGQKALESLEEYKQLEVQLREEITRLETSRIEETTRLQTELVEKDKKLDSDCNGFKEQIKQHSVTICAMEERITKVMKKNKEYQEGMENNEKIILELKAQLAAKEKPAPPPKPKIIPVVQKPAHDFVAMEQLIVVLRKENAELKGHIQEQDDVILGLRKDLAGASARLSDITGELSEGQKQEVEKYKGMMSHKEKEVIEMRQQLAKLSRIIDKQKEELKSVESELSKEKSITVRYKSAVEKEAERVRSLESALQSEKSEQAKQLELLDQEGRITAELTSLGAQCRGERHEQVIVRQREALSELRSRVKTLETKTPPLPTQDQALQQVIMLKKELAEMRANQALSEDKHIQNITSLDREVGRARGLMSSTNAEADMERSAHRETMEALDASENSFLALLGAISAVVELEGIEGLRTLGHIPKDERERLLREREKACERLVGQIRVYKERIARKDELLQGYERDLAKLRQAQELADRKSVQVDSLANDIRTKSEESQYLRESLHRTRDKLDQEKRLNTAIKQRKTFHLENENVHLAPSSHRCRPEDPRAVLKKKNQRDVLKRKNYEIKTLKTELTDKERHLFDTQNKLYTMEHNQLR